MDLDPDDVRRELQAVETASAEVCLALGMHLALQQLSPVSRKHRFDTSPCAGLWQ
jgi:hypothetical protein